MKINLIVLYIFLALTSFSQTKSNKLIIDITKVESIEIRKNTNGKDINEPF